VPALRDQEEQVALFFMHLRYSRSLMLAAPLLWLGIMITLTLGDFLTRGWLTYR
jgi:caa(3)-type oxidase subunit IV